MRDKKKKHGAQSMGTKTMVYYKRLLLIAYCLLPIFLLFTIPYTLSTTDAFADETRLQSLIAEALKNSPEILASEARSLASKFRIPQATSLPDPMFMFGYQNEGWKRYTYGEMQGAQWMFSASQMFPFPGKLSLKGEMASQDAESLKASSDITRLKSIARVKELYYELLLAYKNIDLIKDKALLYSRMEDAAISRYSSGMASQQDVLMAQTEKYMLLEKEEMLKQRIQSIEAMLNAAVGRDVQSVLGRPAEVSNTLLVPSIDELIKIAYENSPEIKTKEKMVASAEIKVKMAKKEFYPDFTVAASLYERRGDFQDMWSLTTTINIPISYKTKQKEAVHEAEASLSEAKYEREATKLMISSAVRDNYSMLKTAEKLMDLYKNGLIPKTYQDVESALAGYMTGKVEAVTVITRLKSIIEFDTFYWLQFTEREKALARIEALSGFINLGTKDKKDSETEKLDKGSGK